MRDFEELLMLFNGVKRESATQYKAECPVCGKRDHLYISTPEAMPKGGIASKLFCQKCGAKAPEIMRAVEVPEKFLYLEEEKTVDARATKATAIAHREHIYRNADGSIFGRKTIYVQPNGDKKPIYWERFDGAKYISGLNGAQAPLYNLNEVINRGNTLFFAEGEKDVDTLTAMGLSATSTPNGGGQAKWSHDFDSACIGRDVVVLTDNDETGEKYGKFIADHLHDTNSIRIIPATAIYPQIQRKGDISDIVKSFGLDAAKRMLLDALEAAPIYQKEARQLKHTAKTADGFGDVRFRFVWDPYIPRGDYTVMMADGGTGKTMLCCGIAAELSKGGAGLPGESLTGAWRNPAKVLIISAEDTGELLKKRLKASGANLSNVYILDCCDSEGMNFTDGIEDFEDTIKACSPELVIIDPWHAFVGETVDVNRVNAMRPILQRLSNLSKRCDCGLLLISHVNKRSQGENANHAATGSTDFINAARSAMRVIFSDDPAENNIRIVVHTKSNYAEAGQSIKFRITKDSGMAWAGFSEITRQTLEEAARQRKKPGEIATQRDIQKEIDAKLIAAVEQHAVRGQTINISYDQMKEEHGELIFGYGQPKRALDVVAQELERKGITLTTGKRVKYNGSPVNGFSVSYHSPDNFQQFAVGDIFG